MMRVLTVRQPWAWAIIHGSKDVENRTRNIAGSYRGPVAIHVAQADADNAPNALWMEAASDRSTTVLREPGKSLARWQPRGVVIGVVDLNEVHNHDEPRPKSPLLVARRPCSEWAMDGHHHLMLTNPRPIDPIPAKGRLGLWRPDPELQAQIEAALS